MTLKTLHLICSFSLILFIWYGSQKEILYSNLGLVIVAFYLDLLINFIQISPEVEFGILQIIEMCLEVDTLQFVKKAATHLTIFSLIS